MEQSVIKTIVEDLIPLQTEFVCAHLRLAHSRKRLNALIVSLYEQTKHSHEQSDSTYTFKDFQSYFKVIKELNK